MDSRTKARIGGGIALDVAGMALLISAIPDADWKLGAGLLLMLGGAWLITSSLRGGSAPVAPDDDAIEAARGRWRPEPELRAAPPRQVRLRPAAKAAAALWLAMLAVGGGYFYLTVFSRNPAPPSRNLLEAEGVRAEATIHRREIRESADGEPRYVLYYNFTDQAGAAVRSSVNVRKTLFDRYHEGDRMETVYLPEDPIAHYLPELTRPVFAERGLLMALVTLACFAYLLENRRRRHHKLVREGAPAAGVAENVRRRGGARAYDVTFRVRGQIQTLRATERNPMRRNGDVLTVLIDATGSGDAELYHQCIYCAVE